MLYWLCCPILELQPLGLVLGSPLGYTMASENELSRDVPYLASAARVAGALHQLNHLEIKLVSYKTLVSQ